MDKTTLLKLDSDNYNIWAPQMEALLIMKELVEPIFRAHHGSNADGVQLPPAEAAAAEAAAEAKRRQHGPFLVTDQKVAPRG